MPAHIHAALMAEYAKDAAETDKPWERWERKSIGQIVWESMYGQPTWSEKSEYRRKPVALCQIEGKDVFPGDKLWHVEFEWVIAQAKVESPNLLRTLGHSVVSIKNLSWTEPPQMKTVYQWAFLRGTWQVSIQFYETEEQARKGCAGGTNFSRLEYTALEVPA